MSAQKLVSLYDLCTPLNETNFETKNCIDFGELASQLVSGVRPKKTLQLCGLLGVGLTVGLRGETNHAQSWSQWSHPPIGVTP